MSGSKQERPAASNRALIMSMDSISENHLNHKFFMKNPIENLNKVFDSRIRLGIMSALLVNAEVNFNELKELIGVTDGNLASHLKTLEENGYMKVQKGFIGRKTNT